MNIANMNQKIQRKLHVKANLIPEKKKIYIYIYIYIYIHTHISYIESLLKFKGINTLCSVIESNIMLEEECTKQIGLLCRIN